MRYLSLFSGIEAATVAWEPLGWECVGVAEIEPFACAVLAHHYPSVPNLGSVTEITDEQIATLGPIDLVVGGSPCQDLSVAGKREGLAGERSGLFYEQVRIFDAARRLCGARWLLWENVPGAFSTNKGQDFAEVVGALAGCGFDVPKKRWKTAGVALGPRGLVEWCVLDAQWYGVPQRRRRVFAVLDTGDWASRPPIFSEQQSLSRDSAPRREAREVAPTIPARSTAGGGLGTDFDFDGGLQITRTLRGEGFDAGEDGTGRGTPLVPVPSHDPACTPPSHLASTTAVAYGLPGNWIGRKPENGGNQVEPFIEQSPCQTSTDRHAVAFTASAQANSYAWESDVNPTLNAQVPNDTNNIQYGIRQGASVRRLTPRECERLQGFPDDHTKIPYRGKPSDKCPDGPRYKATGNSMAVPVMRWLGERIEQAQKVEAPSDE